MAEPLHPRLALALEFAGVLAEVTALATKCAWRAVRPARRRARTARRPGAETPLWNACVVLLRAELKPLGAKVRFARYLGIPKQRVHDFLTNPTRLPDAELTLHILQWLAAKRRGHDLSASFTTLPRHALRRRSHLTKSPNK
jgi:hypothetical protein